MGSHSLKNKEDVMPKGKNRYQNQIGKKPFSQHVSKNTFAKRHLDFIVRCEKRTEKSRTGGKIPYTWEWAYQDKYGTVTAHCRSDARAKIKAILEIPNKKRLPIGVQIERVEFDELT